MSLHQRDMLEISELRPGRTTGVVVVKVTIHNQGGTLVMDGEHKYLVRKRPAGGASLQWRVFVFDSS